MPTDLTGDVILVTGAGRGIGRSAARHLARCGAVVGVSDIDAVTCEETATLIRGSGGTAYAYSGDHASRDTVMAIAASLARTAGRIDAVVNNASLLHYEPIEDVREDMLQRMVGAGFTASVWGAQALLEHYDPTRGGTILNFASPVAYKGFARSAIYSSVKGALVALTRTLAVELGPKNVRVNAVAPGSVPTPGATKYVAPAEYERRAQTIPLRRLGSETDCDYAIAFLLGRESAFVTGAVLHVDGGIVAA